MRVSLFCVCVVIAGAGLAQDRPTPRPDTDAVTDAAGAPSKPSGPDGAAPAGAAASESPIAESAAPAAAPKSTAPREPLIRETDAEFDACLAALRQMGAEFSVDPAIHDPKNPDCGIERPITLTIARQSPNGHPTKITGGAVMRCETARALGRWLNDFVEPAAQAALGDAIHRITIDSIAPGSTYYCRTRVGDGSGKISEHARGNAFDAMSFRFAAHPVLTLPFVPEALLPVETTDLPIAPRTRQGDMIEALQRSIRASACLYFTTVLGPGSDSAHDDHLHVDIRARKGGFRLCQ